MRVLDNTPRGMVSENGMKTPLKLLLGWTFSLGLACGGSGQDPESAASVDAEHGTDQNSADRNEEGLAKEGDAPEEVSGPMNIPTECYKGEHPCTPDPKWVKKLCADVYPGVALYLFQKSSPFTRGYISARRVKAVNASGGVTSGEEWLMFDEEVVFLFKRSADLGGMQVSGAGGGYDAMRLDGSCVTLGSDEVRENVPPKPGYVNVPWQYIGDDMQDALRSLPSVKGPYIERRKECKGAFSGSVTDKCIKRDKELNEAIVKALQSGESNLPQPQERP